jgi:hypothetical protein
MTTKDGILTSELKHLEAKAVYEEVYDLMAILHHPTHPIVLEIASLLIPVLINLKEFYDAERYARFLYDNLI